MSLFFVVQYELLDLLHLYRFDVDPKIKRHQTARKTFEGKMSRMLLWQLSRNPSTCRKISQAASKYL